MTTGRYARLGGAGGDCGKRTTLNRPHSLYRAIYLGIVAAAVV